MVFNGIQWYSMVFNGIQWYSMVFNGIQWYSMVYHWHFFVRGYNLKIIPLTKGAVLRNRRNGLSARNQYEIHENDLVLREMCRFTTLSGESYYIIRQEEFTTLSDNNYYIIRQQVYYIIG